jgi:threonine dehydrogenase-like Zn-dependent dehydrogenase
MTLAVTPTTRLMRAAVFHAGEFSVADIPGPPAPGPGQVMLETAACGICGSDLSAAKDPQRFVEVSREAGNTLSIFDPNRPVVLGHEYAGRVIDSGPDVTSFAVGDRVTGIGLVTERESGLPTIIGYSNSYPGAFGQRLVVDASWVHHIPDGMSFEHATLAEPLHVGETHVQQSGLTHNHTAIVIGAGPIGLGTVAAARAHGAAHVIAVEPSARRREVALRLGAHVALDPPADDPLDAWRSRTGGQGSIIAFETSGRAGMINQLMHTLPAGSRIQVVGSSFRDEVIRPVVGQWRHIAINFGNGPVERPYEITLQRLASGEIDGDSLITGRVPLDGVAGAFDELRDPERHVKIVVLPQLAPEKPAGSRSR